MRPDTIPCVLYMNSLILIGPMGAGKTAIGRRLANALAVPFHDTDLAIQERTGVDIGFIFEKEGEAGFRRREEAVIAELASAGDAVIATGGGAVLSPGNRMHMSNGTVIFLETSVDWQLARTRRGHHRPLLDTADPRRRLTEIYAQREPLYRACANIVVNTDDRRVNTVVGDILRQLGRTEDAS